MAVTASQSVLSGLPRRLVQDGIIAEEAVQEAIEGSRKASQPLVSFLVQNALADPRSIAVAAAHEFGVPLLDLDAMDIDLDVIRSVDQKLIGKHSVLPLSLRGKRMFLAVSDPTNLAAIDEIKFQSQLRVEPVVVEQDKLDERVQKILEAIDTSMSSFDDDDFDLENLDVSSGEEQLEEVTRDDVDDAPVVRFVNKVLLDAIKRGASDVHFEPYEKYFRVRTRLDGVLNEIAQPPAALAGKVSARLKVMARLDIAERRIPQDGRIKMRLSKNRAIDFRVNTCPTLFGEKIVLRILDPSSAKLGIEMLGYEDHQRELYEDALSKPYGMFLVTGPTGSGKTVSLYSGINLLNQPHINISTAEDPVEINLAGVNQVQVDERTGMTFEKALKAFLRQDPDIILVGEIRDLTTGNIAIKAAQTGHMVMSTLHTNDAPQTLTRMVDMGIKPFAIATAINIITAQRLGRRLHSCKQQTEIPAEALLKEGFTQEQIDGGLTIYEPVGCDACNGGHKGRVGIYQVMEISEPMKRLVMEGRNSIDIADQALSEGIPDIRQSALKKVADGMLDIAEMNRVTQE